MRSSILVVLLFQVIGCCLAADSRKFCYDDIPSCVETLKDLLVNEDVFWYGKPYSTVCPNGPISLDCTNPRPTKLNIISRLYDLNDTVDPRTELPSDLQLAKVTFSSPKGSYFACGHEFNSPAVAQYNVDPASVISVGQYAIDHKPWVEWDVSGDPADTYYTVIMWDSGFFWCHALYINTQGGDIYSGYAIDPYFGPKNPLIQPNVYVMTVFKQNGLIDINTAKNAFQHVWGANLGQLSAIAFTDMLGINPKLVAANILTVPGDGYGLQFQKEAYMVNHCPSLITAKPVFKQILDAAGVQTTWKEESSELHNKVHPYIATMFVDIKAVYSMPKDVKIDSCCVKHTYTKSMFVTDPLGASMTRPVVVSNKPRMSISPIQIAADRYNPFKMKIYTLMMVDLTDYIRVGGSPVQNFFIHWMVHTIYAANVLTGIEQMSYVGPTPYKSNNPQAYMFLLFEQTSPVLNTSSVSNFISNDCPVRMDGRCGTDFSGLLKALNLNTIVGATWFTAEQDAYTRKNLYSVPGGLQMADVCKDQNGFEDPCPEYQYCNPDTSSGSRIGGFAFMSMLFTSSIIMAATKMF